MEKMEFFGIPLELSEVDYNPARKKLSREALFHGAQKTDYGAIAIFPEVKSRLEKLTEIQFGDPTNEQHREIAEAFSLMKGKPIYCLDRLMGQKKQFLCRLFTSKESPEPALIWGSTLREIHLPHGKPEFLTISLPFPRQHVYVFPDHNLVILLGVDYGGEHKMASLRLFKYVVKVMEEGLGLHGSLITFCIKDVLGILHHVHAVFMAGSGTGKTTLTSDGYGLKLPERTVFRQDDIVAWLHSGEVLGTEQCGFYVITAGLTKEAQPAIWDALHTEGALFENVVIKDGKPDFKDLSLSKNPRGVVPVKKLSRTDGLIDAPHLDCLFLLCRTGGIIPPIMRLSPERATYEFMLGRTIDTAAVDPSRVGQSRNLPGWDPFMIGRGPLSQTQAEEGNIFLRLVRKHSKTETFLVNTGSFGGSGGEDARKITVEDSVGFIRHVVSSRIFGKKIWRPSIFGFGYEELEDTRGGMFDAQSRFPAHELAELVHESKKREAEWLEQFRAYLDPSVMSLCMR